MSTTLSQTAAASFPDRPVANGSGLSVDLAAGSAGQTLSLDVSADSDVLHVRMMIAPASLTDGRVVLMSGRAAGLGVFALQLDGVGSQIVVDMSAASLGTGLLADVAWHAVEIAIDTTNESATLWCNGIQVDSATGLTGIAQPDELLIGAVHKDDAAAGSVYIDEIVVANGYVGPVIVEPVSANLDDPRRWAVIYNTASAESVQWADDYRAKRSVPYANLVGLPLDTGETVSEVDFSALRDAVSGYLSTNGLAGQINGLIVGHGVPSRYTRSDTQIGSVAAQLQLIDGNDTAVANPVAAIDAPVRPTAELLAGTRITAHIDGPSLADSTALVDRAIEIEAKGLGDGDDATLWFDPVTTGSLLEPIADEMIEWAASIDRQALRLPIEQTAPTDPPTDVAFESITHDAFFWGWFEAAPPDGFFAQPGGARVFAAQLYTTAATAPTLRDADSDHWAISSLQAGYAATFGTTRGISTTALPLVRPFFRSLRQGWTLGEAWAVSTQLLRRGVELVGDPLMKVPLPKQGWNVFGPFDPVSSADLGEPIVMLRESERSFIVPTASRPPDGGSGAYVVRRVDAEGREESGITGPVVANLSGQSVLSPSAPISPQRAGWMPRVVDGDYQFNADWPATFAELGIVRVELVEQPLGGEATVVDQHDVPPNASSASFVRPTIDTTSRFRLRAFGVSGGQTNGPWSDWISTPTPEPVNLIPMPSTGGAT